uniref:Lysophospholipid acyltransferase 7 n=1 Tax=Meloidogyne hapla TaxID=6305 RepID=A0A1I8BAM4_MELHA
MESTSNFDKTSAYNEMCKNIAQSKPLPPNKLKRFDKFKANFRFYIQQCIRNSWLNKTLMSVAVVCFVNGTIYYNYGPDHPCNLVLWHYYKHNDKLTPEQLWKARMITEYNRSHLLNMEGPLLAERDRKWTTFGDFFYGFLLLISSILALLLRHFGSLNTRRKLDGLLGFGITLFVAGRLLFCSLIIVVVHLLIGLSYEIADFRLSKKSDNESNERFIEKEPSTFEAFNYLYNFTGLFTGPYFTYRTYSDALTKWKRPLLWDKLKPLLVEKMRTLSWSLPSLIFLTWLDPVNVLRSERIFSVGGLFYDFIWCAIAFLYLRMRIYSAWMVAESICLLTGIGLYPKEGKSTPGNGPVEMQKIVDIDWNDPSVEFDSETINNLDIPNVEHSDGFRSGMRAWNRTVQFWLANFVYRRSNRSIRYFWLHFTMLFILLATYLLKNDSNKKQKNQQIKLPTNDEKVN